jgi:dephospho-CoA kinase
VKRKVRKKIIGILGGIGSGKSTVAGLFSKLGCGVIDADKIAHQMLKKTLIKKELQKLFGSGIISKKGKIDRRKLAEAAFKSRQKAAQLNRIIHPAVLSRIEQLIKEYNRQPGIKAIVLDVPLLAETGWTKRCDKLIFVSCNLKNRLKRAKKSGLFDKNKLKIREKFQISLDKKRKIAENIVDNNVGLANVKKQILKIFSNFMENG